MIANLFIETMFFLQYKCKINRPWQIAYFRIDHEIYYEKNRSWYLNKIFKFRFMNKRLIIFNLFQ